MLCNDLIKKAVFQAASLAVILSISTKLVLACASINCSNGIESNICAIESNLIDAQRYFNYSLAIFIAVLILSLLRKAKGFFAAIICLISVSLPMCLHFISGNEECDFFSTQVARWLFYFSIFAFLFQLISWLNQIRTVRNLR